MVPTLANLPDAYRGDTYGPIMFEFFDENDIPINLEGIEVSCQVGRRHNYREIVLQWPDDTHTYSLSGNAIILHAVPPEKMKFDPDIYFYDLELKTGEIVRTYLHGYLTLKDEVSNY